MRATRIDSNVIFARDGKQIKAEERAIHSSILSICSFSAKKPIKTHIRTEHQHFRHVCHMCAKGLHEHLVTHESVKGPRMKCELCPSSFRNSRALRAHVVLVHQKPSQTYQCPHCPKVKKSAANLSSHIYSTHNFKTVKCQLCAREFRTAKSLGVSCFLFDMCIARMISIDCFRSLCRLTWSIMPRWI